MRTVCLIVSLGLTGCFVEAGNPPDKQPEEKGSKLRLTINPMDAGDVDKLEATLLGVTLVGKQGDRDLSVDIDLPEAVPLNLAGQDGLVDLLESTTVPAMVCDYIEIRFDPQKPFTVTWKDGERHTMSAGEEATLTFEGPFTVGEEREEELTVHMAWDQSLRRAGGVSRFEPRGEMGKARHLPDLVAGADDAGEGSRACLFRSKSAALRSDRSEDARGSRRTGSRGQGSAGGRPNAAEEGGEQDEVEQGAGNRSGRGWKTRVREGVAARRGTTARKPEGAGAPPVAGAGECREAVATARVRGGRVRFFRIPPGDYVLRTFSREGQAKDQILGHSPAGE